MVKRITNKHPGNCAGCGTRVAPGEGYAEKPSDTEPWIVRCATCVNGPDTDTVADRPTPEQTRKANTKPAAKPTFPPTAEQREAIDAFSALLARAADRRGLMAIAIQALAGTGKTSTLVKIGESTDQPGQFIAFNKAIVKEAATRFPSNVTCSTMHSLAFRAIGKHYAHRLDSQRMTSAEIARRLDIEPFYCNLQDEERTRKVVQPGKLGGLVMSAIAKFCNSDDTEPSTKHFRYVDGIDQPDGYGRRTFENNDRLREHLAPALVSAWRDLQQTDGQLRFTPDAYLKIWALGQPKIPGAFIMVDEAQDLSPVMLSVLKKQTVPTVLVGDRNQIIYTWRGSVDAMSVMPTEATTFLTWSWRFGEEIAGAANAVLDHLEGDIRVVGKGKPGTVGPCTSPDAILTRTNAGAIDVLLTHAEMGQQVHLVGGGAEVERFARAALDLQQGRKTEHPELCIFDNWNQVLTYVSEDELGSELAPMVRLIEKYGAEMVIRASGSSVSEKDADLVVSTTHKSKGCEWDSVALYGDFPEIGTREDNDEELRLLYVAVTRAKTHLDITGCGAALDIIDPGSKPSDPAADLDGKTVLVVGEEGQS